ncbi:MAG: hypothetical protein A2046_03720 [Bacteroidetes bacterium GWA2_30_7]|nr:MAG: hypothetical protein A2046_03720 [Bacteroidetes bacterium GWA2_30_7]
MKELEELKKYWIDLDKTIPRINLAEKNISNLKAILSREKLLELLPKNGIVAEIGVWKGDFSEVIIEKTSPRKLHLIDAWSSNRYNDEIRQSVEIKFKTQIKKGQIEINYGLSIDVVDTFNDNYFDWIYIDTDHSYKTTKIELEKFSKKVKPSGIIAGHDYIIGNWNGMVKYGVIEAVYEFCSKNDWEIIYITMEGKGHHPSFAIRKI